MNVPRLTAFAVLVVALLVVAATHANAQGGRPVWPRMFDVAFGVSTLANITDNNPPLVNKTAHFYYNWNLKAQRIDYPDACIPIFPGEVWKAGCTLQFNPVGMYIIAPDLGITCCLALPGITTIPPNFLAPFDASTFLIPTPDIWGVLHNSNFWTTDAGFFYWTDTVTGQDIQFVDGDVLTWNFVPTFHTVSQPASLFKLPAGCASSCGSGIAKSALRDPIVRLARLHQDASKSPLTANPL